MRYAINWSHEYQPMSAGLQDTQDLMHDLGKPGHPITPSASITVPRLPHEADGSGRVGEECLKSVGSKSWQYVKTIAAMNGATHLGVQ
jgi:hypothetical protein